MSIFAIIVCLCIGVAWRRSEKNYYNPAALMGILWGIICFMANLRSYGLYAASDYTYFLITLGIAFFGLGSYVAKSLKVKFSRGSIPRLANPSCECEINYTVVRILCVVSVFLLLPSAISSAKLLMSGMDMSDIRTGEVVEKGGNIVIVLINNYIVRPFSFAILPIFAVEFFVSKKRDTTITICSIIIIIERVLIEGGRFIIAYILCALLVSFAVTKRKKKIKKSIVITFWTIVAVSVIAIYIVTLSRGTEEIGRSLYAYICGCVPHLSIRLDAMQNLDTYTFGLSSMNGIVHYIASIFENLGASYPDFLMEVRELINVEDKVVISDMGGQFNAFVSPIYYMYIDGREIGVMIGMFIYGFVSYRLYAKLKQNIYPRDLAIYLLIVQGLVTTMVRIQFSVTYYTIAFFFIVFLINQKKSSLEQPRTRWFQY